MGRPAVPVAGSSALRAEVGARLRRTVESRLRREVTAVLSSPRHPRHEVVHTEGHQLLERLRDEAAVAILGICLEAENRDALARPDQIGERMQFLLRFVRGELRDSGPFPLR